MADDDAVYIEDESVPWTVSFFHHYGHHCFDESIQSYFEVVMRRGGIL